jgi:hypothetical protein
VAKGDKSAQRERQAARKKAGVVRPKCASPKTNGEPCNSYAVEGGTKCNKHGGTPRAKPGGLTSNTKTGRRSLLFRHLADEGRLRIAMFETQPELLDHRQPVALSRYIVDEILIEVTAEGILKQARQMFPGLREYAVDDPMQGFEADELMLARTAILERMHRVITAHAGNVNNAAKAAKLDEMMRMGAMPAFQRLAEVTLRLGDRYVPEAQRAQFRADFKMAIEAAVAEVAKGALDEVR